MIKLVAFDWNGTLLADSRLAAAADGHALTPYTKKPVTLKQMQSHFTIPVINYFISLGLDQKTFKKDYKKINAYFNSYYEARVSGCRTRSGVRDSLNFISENKISTIIYSNHVTNYIITQIERLKIQKYFKTILARGEGDQSHMHSRGKEQKLFDYIKQNKFKPNEVISVGDTEEEIEIGKKYGYHTVAITGGFNSTGRLKKHKPDFLIHNMKDLIGIIKKLNKK